MEHYINIDTLIAEIRKRLLPVIRDKHYDEWAEGQNSERIAILDIINTLEVREIDSDKLEEIARHLLAVKEHTEDLNLSQEEWSMIERIGYPERFKAQKKEHTMKSGIELIAEERQRQINVEGWTEEHDAKHTDDSLALAASCYAIPSALRHYYGPIREAGVPVFWPWDKKYWKPCPNDRIRELVKAGALIAAEIDRLQKSNVQQ